MLISPSTMRTLRRLEAANRASLECAWGTTKHQDAVKSLETENQRLRALLIQTHGHMTPDHPLYAEIDRAVQPGL